jgi:hypothetical protein
MAANEHLQWAKAFARQSRSDFAAREQLLGGLPSCHQLHYLQMALEKAAKAHLYFSNADVRYVHSYISKVIPEIVKNGLSRSPGHDKQWIMPAVRELALKLERLHPQVAAQTSPANCEYPWLGPKGTVLAPIDYDFGIFPASTIVATKMIKEVITRLDELSKIESK